jgi:hypothetical protein
MRATLCLIVVCAFGLSIAGSGCAPPYHHYADCHVNCRYCPPPPLPYVHYPGCVCHSCAASKYLTIEEAKIETESTSVQQISAVD